MLRFRGGFSKLSVVDKIESEYPFFLLYLRSIATRDASRMELLKTASEKIIFKNIGRFIKRIITLVTEWRYSQAEACSNLSEAVPSKTLGSFLYRL
ncbi:hypothetical protein J7L70_02615 [Candidatus Bathyarchaeota archaeon]|nr:hypothetical protein [Candidatus Bathyarchaeota archaeon]